ncbi:LacI family DNA-binding transcriptional regulator [Bifidobacterium choloepi]|uniref:LacI family DNA-binding transcriptional regulator n=1 Tax=Bifidobacterium choloepi TaxID=2614131 RepID=A0A6I5N065_9BIFI|nr:LacI family DNA-binding transcriptional regulator [Bifidobacterium choloepi]NEG69947.1 LacI family DNA-binding transcriptional regulator [Bifidobacterium choloepi]
MVGMRDVAKRAGVSLSSVSLVVNGTGYVSDEMRERVERAMAELDYVPNQLARNFHRNRAGIIGVIVPTIRHPFFATLTAAIERELSARGLRAMLCSTADAAEGEADYVDMLERRTVDGLIVGSHTAHNPDYWSSIGRPIVAFDRVLGATIPAVCSDHEAGGRLVARQLVESGCRHVVMVGGPREQFPVKQNDSSVDHVKQSGAAADESFDDKTRETAGIPGTTGTTTFPTVRYYMTLERLLDEAGIRHDYIEAGEVSSLEGYQEGVMRAFREFPDMDALVSSDIGAATAVCEARRRGESVPELLEIVAYDGTYVADVAGVSCVRQDFDAIAKALVGEMVALMDGADGDGDEGAGDGGAAATAPLQTIIPVMWRPASTTR